MLLHRNRRRSQRGAASVETALSSLLFFLALLPIFDFSRSLYRLGSLQHATRAAARFATTGATLEDPGNPGEQLSREESIIELVREYSGLSELASANIDVSSMTVAGQPGMGAGGPGEFVTVTVNYDVALVTPVVSALFPEGVYQVQTSATFLNEEFLPGS